MVATVEQLAALIGGRLVGDGSVPISAARPVDEAGPGDITFIADERYAKMLRTSPAAAAIVGPHFKVPAPERPEPLPIIEVDDPLTAFVAIRSHLGAATRPRPVGIHPRACVATSAKIGENVAIYPLAYVGEDAEIGEGCTIHPGVVIGNGCRLGRDVTLHANVVLYDGVILGDRVEIHSGAVIGGDGFKYALRDGRHVKVPHTGDVEVGNDVEIGANCTIDRATFGTTRIGEGTKIDNLVMIGHNNSIGRHNLLCGQAGIAGSCKTGDYVTLAGQAGIKDHIEIGDRGTAAAQAGVQRNIGAGVCVMGSPAIPIREHLRTHQLLTRLPAMDRQLRRMTAQLALLTAAVEQPEPEGAGQRSAPASE